MALIDKIPMPGTGFDGMKEGLEWMNKLLMAPVEMRQKQAQAKHEEALANLESNPLKLDLLKAQIDHYKALSNKASRSGSAADGTTATKPFLTLNQKTVQAIDNTIPTLEAISSSDFPGQTISKYLHPSLQADYMGKISQVTDALVSALQLPKTNESIALAKTMVMQQTGESRDAYKKRLESVIDDLKTRRKRHAAVLESGSAFGNDELGANEDQLQKWADEAIAKGASRDAVMRKLSEMRNQAG